MGGAFSAIPFARLLDGGAHIVAAVIPAPSGAPGAQPARLVPPAAPLRADILLQAHTPSRTMPDRAHQQRIPLIEVRAIRASHTRDLLASFQPDAIITACFPFLIPASILSLAPHGGYNLHPSLLPHLRGPEPLFWTLRLGEPAGVSVHRMSARADAGDIVAQAPLALPDGIAYSEVEHLCAERGGEVLCEVLRAIEAGTLKATPQDEHDATYFPTPTAEDFIVTPDWSVRRAYNFLSAYAGDAPTAIRIGAEIFAVRRVIERLPMGVMDGDAEAFRREGDGLMVRFADGVLRVSL